MYALSGINQCSKSLQGLHKTHKQALVGITKTYTSLFLTKCAVIGVTLRTVAFKCLLEPKTVANGKGPQ